MSIGCVTCYMNIAHSCGGGTGKQTKLLALCITKLSGTPGRVWRGAPRLGQDTDEILRVVLGRGEEEIRRLHAEGTV